MKLRNKKTGEVWNVWSFYDENQTINLKYFNNDEIVILEYSSLAKLNEDWEDYIEPYIKDEKVRKFVRDWAEHWKIDKVVIRFIDSNRIDLIGFPSSTKTGREIDIQRTVVRNEIIYGNRYTINELCGEEEEWQVL